MTIAGRAGLVMIASTPLVGCSMGSGIVPIGPDTYALSEMRAPVRGGGAEAQRAVLTEAAGFCQQQGRSVALLELRPDGDPRGRYWPTAFDATFQCRGAGGILPPIEDAGPSPQVDNPGASGRTR